MGTAVSKFERPDAGQRQIENTSLSDLCCTQDRRPNKVCANIASPKDQVLRVHILGSQQLREESNSSGKQAAKDIGGKHSAVKQENQKPGNGISSMRGQNGSFTRNSHVYSALRINGTDWKVEDQLALEDSVVTAVEKFRIELPSLFDIQALTRSRKLAMPGQLFADGVDIRPYGQDFWACVVRSMRGRTAEECVDVYVVLQRSPVARFKVPLPKAGKQQSFSRKKSA